MNHKRYFSPAEWQILEFVTAHGSVTVREAAEHFAASDGWARTTVMTMIERLRTKGYLTRDESGAIHRYAPSRPRSDLMQSLVRDFVEKALGGSISPFVAYLGDKTDLTADELAALRRIVDSLDTQDSQANAKSAEAEEEDEDA